MPMNHLKVSACYQVLFTIVLVYNHPAKCNETANSMFNASIRDYLEHEDKDVSNVKTLQKEGYAHYRNILPSHQREKNKGDSESANSEYQHYGRGFHQEQAYPLNEYEEPLPYGYHGYQDYHNAHFDGHQSPHHLGFGHHHKYYDSGIALKAILWPVAGLALLGAAAALVTNPVLLQLGVVSGRRRRRDTEELTSGPELDLKLAHLYKENDFNNQEQKQTNNQNINYVKSDIHKISKKSGAKRLLLRNFPSKQMTVKTLLPHPVENNRNFDDSETNYIRIPLKVRN